LFKHLKDLFIEAHANEVIDIENLNKVPKDVYKDFTSSIPPPKYENMPWNDIWDRVNRPVLKFHVRDVMFLLIHNKLPTRERLFRLNQCRDDQCDLGDVLENIEHLFTS
jgi:hypothetical protein